jgi:hypothetical protein
LGQANLVVKLYFTDDEGKASSRVVRSGLSVEAADLFNSNVVGKVVSADDARLRDNDDDDDEIFNRGNQFDSPMRSPMSLDSPANNVNRVNARRKAIAIDGAAGLLSPASSLDSRGGGAGKQSRRLVATQVREEVGQAMRARGYERPDGGLRGVDRDGNRSSSRRLSKRGSKSSAGEDIYTI